MVTNWLGKAPLLTRYFVAWEEVDVDIKGSFIIEVGPETQRVAHQLYDFLREQAVVQLGENGSPENLTITSISKL